MNTKNTVAEMIDFNGKKMSKTADRVKVSKKLLFVMETQSHAFSLALKFGSRVQICH